jgi:uncharacterized protein YgiM (DUF1202 family)
MNQVSSQLQTPTATSESDNVVTFTPTPDILQRVALSCTVTASEALNLRAGPGLSYSVIGWLYNGDVLEPLGKSGDWLKVEGGWIHSAFVECDR